MTHTRQHLTHLESAGLVHLAQTRPEVEYLFRHALIQDAAYTVLLLNDRKRFGWKNWLHC
jgi:predicted ATPase